MEYQILARISPGQNWLMQMYLWMRENKQIWFAKNIYFKTSQKFFSMSLDKVCVCVCVFVCSSLAWVVGCDAMSFANICFAFLAPGADFAVSHAESAPLPFGWWVKGGSCRGRCILLDFHDQAGWGWCAGKCLVSSHERCHKFTSKFFKEQPPPVALPLIPAWVHLSPQHKGVVWRHVKDVLEYHQGPTGCHLFTTVYTGNLQQK